jgi:hypothetical protein
VLHHRDLEEQNPRARNSQTIGRSFVSVLSSDLSRACVDGLVPSSSAGYPRLQLHNDTLYQLEQDLVPGSSSRVQTLIRKFIIDISKCVWLETRG